MKFYNYFEDTIECPDDIAFNPLPFGIEYSCVSSTFLDGFINYVEILKSFVIGRYYDWDEEFEEEFELELRNSANNCNLIKKMFKTKNEIYNKLLEPEITVHSKLDTYFQDDVLILAKAKSSDEEECCYYYFWYDRDCSDSCIGRFKTEDSEDVVVKSFVKHMKEIDNPYGEKEIPLLYFQKWGYLVR